MAPGAAAVRAAEAMVVPWTEAGAMAAARAVEETEVVAAAKGVAAETETVVTEPAAVMGVAVAQATG